MAGYGQLIGAEEPVQRDVAPVRQALNKAVAKEKSAIDHELSILHAAVQRVHQVVSSLESATGSVSSQMPPTDQSMPQHEQVGSSMVYNAIHEAAAGLHLLEDRVMNIIRNLEV